MQRGKKSTPDKLGVFWGNNCKKALSHLHWYLMLWDYLMVSV